MIKTILNMTIGLGVMALAAQQLPAQTAQTAQNCAPRPMVLEQLASDFGETRRSIGLARQGQVVELFASAETGSWTITITLPNGLTCLVAAGQAFESLAETLPPSGSDA